jgi:hypothetical protein
LHGTSKCDGLGANRRGVLRLLLERGVLSRTAWQLIRIMLRRTAPPLIAANFPAYGLKAANLKNRLGGSKMKKGNQGLAGCRLSRVRCRRFAPVKRIDHVEAAPD